MLKKSSMGSTKIKGAEMMVSKRLEISVCDLGKEWYGRLFS
jgi:hypothetical protein